MNIGDQSRMLISVEEWKLLKICLDKTIDNHVLFSSDRDWEIADTVNKKLKQIIDGFDKKKL